MSRRRAHRWMCAIVGAGLLQAATMLAPSASIACPPNTAPPTATPPPAATTPPATDVPAPTPPVTPSAPTAPPPSSPGNPGPSVPASGSTTPPVTTQPTGAQPSTNPGPSDAGTPTSTGSPSSQADPTAADTLVAPSEPDPTQGSMTSTVSPSPVASGTPASSSGALAPSPAAPSGRSEPDVVASLPAYVGAFRATVRQLFFPKVARHTAAAIRKLPRSAGASGWATTHDATAARDLTASDLVGAYGLVDSGLAPQGDVVLSPSPLASSKQTGGDARHHRSATGPSSNSGPVNRTTRGARGPQGGMQSSSGGGGAASPLARTTRIGLVAQPCLRFTTGPVLRLVGMQGRRLERPG